MINILQEVYNKAYWWEAVLWSCIDFLMPIMQILELKLVISILSKVTNTRVKTRYHWTPVLNRIWQGYKTSRGSGPAHCTSSIECACMMQNQKTSPHHLGSIISCKICCRRGSTYRSLIYVYFMTMAAVVFTLSSCSCARYWFTQAIGPVSK